MGGRVRDPRSVIALREPAFKLLDRLQDVDPAQQTSALFLTAAVVAEALRLDAHEELARARRMIRNAEGPFTSHVQAIRDYAANELSKP